MQRTALFGSKLITLTLPRCDAKKQIKEWRRDWKINLIERENQHWADLVEALTL